MYKRQLLYFRHFFNKASTTDISVATSFVLYIRKHCLFYILHKLLYCRLPYRLAIYRSPPNSPSLAASWIMASSRVCSFASSRFLFTSLVDVFPAELLDFVSPSSVGWLITQPLVLYNFEPEKFRLVKCLRVC